MTKAAKTKPKAKTVRASGKPRAAQTGGDAAPIAATTKASRLPAPSGTRRVRPARRWYGRRTGPRSSGPPPAKLPGAFRLSVRALALLKSRWQLFLVLGLIYAGLSVLFVQGVSTVSTALATKSSLDQAYGTSPAGSLKSGASLYAYLVGGATSSAAGSSAGVYQALLVIIVSLAVMYALRRVHAGDNPRVRDSFYKGMHPLVPLLLVLLVGVVQLIPFGLGTTFYSLVVTSGAATTFLEQALCLVVFIGLSALSFRFIISTVVAAYVVTLPNMTPLESLRLARDLVRGRRWAIFRKLVFLLVALLVLLALILIPTIIIYAPAAVWLFFLLNPATLILAHGYLYVVYRELL